MSRTLPILVCWAIYRASLQPVSAEHLSPLSSAPDWKSLAAFQQTISHHEFTQLLSEIYAPGVDLAPWFAIEPSQVRIAKGDGDWFTLEFSESSRTETPPRYWRTPEKLSDGIDLPLSG